jgi:hypothetical protein
MKLRSKSRAWLSVMALLPLAAVAQPPDSMRLTHHEFSVQQAID